MTSDELDDRRRGANDPSGRPGGVSQDDEISLWPLFRTIWAYRHIIVVSISSISSVFLLWALSAYAFQPVERQAGLEFRFTFDGADAGVYPNGLVFSPSEIIGPSVLTEVFEANELERYVTYESFKSKLFVLEQNRQLELLDLEFQAKLGEPGVSPVDRAALEGEYLTRREASRIAQYGLVYSSSSTASDFIPDTLLNKVLNDILAAWADQAVTRKGALTYGGNVFSKNLLLEEFTDEDDYILRVDILRGKTNRLLGSLAQLAELPGANVIRVGESQISLPELQAKLEDLKLYRLEPLASYIVENGLTRDADGLEAYIGNRLFQLELDHREAEGRAKILEDSLSGYLSDRARETGPDGMLSGSPLDGVSTTVIPALGDSFLDRLLAIADETQDVQFRQDLTNRIIEAGQEIITVERERGYYTRVGELMQSRPGSRGREMSTEVDARFETLYAAVAQRIEESDAIHAGLAAQNLSPRTGLFRITSPFSIVARRLVTARTLAPTGLFVLLVSIMMVPLVCLGYHYFRREVLVARLEGLQ